MDKYQSYRVFAAVSEKLSFSQAADELNLPKATVSTTIQDLEFSLGVKLLNRTTRQVTLTPEGLVFLERCKQMLNDVEEAESIFRVDPARMRGKIRVDMSVGAAKSLVIPLLPQFFEMYPEIEIELSSTDHTLDLLREGIDCVLRGGGRTETGLIEKDLGEIICLNCASPEYIAKFGKPKNLDDLKNHRLIHYTQVFGSRTHGFEYFDGEKYRELKMRSAITVNSTISLYEACLAGLGIAQLPIQSVRGALRDGSLVELLPKHRAEPYKLKLVYHERRLLTKRVRIFMEWLESAVRGSL